ncbi:MAG TPA: hypothetical protein VLL25_03995 [Acidimicrobiales bacterium]|nr:hypothetical protein [Acidimicrobiales bacterium]
MSGAEEEKGLALLLQTLRRQAAEVEALTEARDEAVRNRDAIIVQLYVAGLSLRTIAEAANLTHTTIARIVGRHSS